MSFFCVLYRAQERAGHWGAHCVNSQKLTDWLGLRKHILIDISSISRHSLAFKSFLERSFVFLHLIVMEMSHFKPMKKSIPNSINFLPFLMDMFLLQARF